MSRHRPRGRGGLRHVARALQSYKKLRHPQGGRRAEREQTLPRREQADKNRDHPAKNIRPRQPFGRRQQPFGSLKTGDAPPKAALPGLCQGRFSLHRAAAEAPRATPRRHAPGSHPPGATPPAGRHATRRRQKSARRGPTKTKKRAAALPVRRFYVYLQCSNPRATAAPGPARAARVLPANH